MTMAKLVKKEENQIKTRKIPTKLTSQILVFKTLSQRFSVTQICCPVGGNHDLN